MGVRVTHVEWSIEDNAKLAELWAAGKSGAEIAAIMGGHRTRNAIIGRVHRMGLLPRRDAHLQKLRREHKRRPPQAPLARSGGIHKSSPPIAPAPPPQPMAGIVAAPVAPLMLPLLDLEHDSCRWSYGDTRAKDFGFCGHKVKLGSSWCPAHHALVYQPISRATKGERSALRDLRSVAA